MDFVSYMEKPGTTDLENGHIVVVHLPVHGGIAVDAMSGIVTLCSLFMPLSLSLLVFHLLTFT